MRAAELAGVAEAIGEHQAAFGIGVDDLNRFAGHGDLHVAWLLRLAGGHVFGGEDNRCDLHFWLKERDGAHDADHGGAAGHVVLHFLHAVGGLDGDAASVEGDAFTDQTEVYIFCRAVRFIAQDDERGGSSEPALRPRTRPSSVL